jgi:hypothetical protein
LQVINQYEVAGARANRYDVTVLVNGLPMVHIELKRRGVGSARPSTRSTANSATVLGGLGLVRDVQLSSAATVRGITQHRAVTGI